MRVAASRLIEAAAELGPDDRALLNLLVNHGVDEAFLLRALRTDQAHLEARYLLLAARLGEVLELPAPYVQEQLDELVRSAREYEASGAESANGASAGSESGPVPLSAPAPSGAAAPAESARVEKTPVPEVADKRAPGRARRRTRPAVVLLVVLVIVIVVVAIILSGGSSKHVHGRGTSPATGRANPNASTGGRDHGKLVALPGAPAGATGSIRLAGPANAPRLVVLAAGLPAAGTGHYEVWLYNSVIDSRALANLGASGGRVTVSLPANYRRYRWIDVSRQPAGSTVHSGVSVLRVAVPGGV
jgi:hypothetical protein